MTLQERSWVKLGDLYHYQIKGRVFCGEYGYGQYEDSNPPKKERCKKCNQELK